MKRIETREEVEKKDRTNKIIIGVILAVLMILSTLGYALLSGDEAGSSGEKVSYGGFVFYRSGGLWQLDVQENSFYFTYLPNETRSVDIQKNINNFAGKPLYFAGDSAGVSEISRNMQYLVPRMQEACTEFENCTGNLPIKNCSSNLIVFREGNGSIISDEANCTFIISNDSVRDADAFLYKIFGIKQ